MSLITVNNISKSFGDNDILDDITFSITTGSKIGIVGPNGSGKTTLLNILSKREKPDSGNLFYSNNIQIGYLPQILNVDYLHSPLEECYSVFTDIYEIQSKLMQLSKLLEKNPSDEQLLMEYGNQQNLYELKGGYSYETSINQILFGLGIDSDTSKRPWQQLSGGQKTRSYLAKILLTNPNILLLDEPTNYLDISAIEWLESYLKNFSGSQVVVSHDRYFLDQCVNTIFEISAGFQIYKGNYSDYLLQREDRYKKSLDEYNSLKETIDKEEAFIVKNIAGQNSKQAQGRRTRLERLLKETEFIKPTKARTFSLKIDDRLRSGNIVLKTENLSVGYQDDKKVLFTVPDIILLRGECAALIGPNGAGKSTFLKIILKQLQPLTGNVELGSSLHIGYFSQTNENLNLNNTVLQEIIRYAPNKNYSEIYNYLARYMFFENDVNKEIKLLSGGERERLSLAILALQDSNLLLLDEPMNHLDIQSQEMLQTVIKDFKGTIILVSHDRYLINSVATQIWEISTDNKKLTVYNGTYSEYKIYKDQCALLVNRADDKIVVKKENKKLINISRKKERIQKELEDQINQLEIKEKEISSSLSSPNLSVDKAVKLGIEYEKVKKEIDELTNTWFNNI